MVYTAESSNQLLCNRVCVCDLYYVILDEAVSFT